MRKGRCIILLLSLCCLVGLSACRNYVVGIAPVYTEERSDAPGLTYRERVAIEEGYYEAVNESRRFSKTVSPLALECGLSLGGLCLDPKKKLYPDEYGLDYTREFYRKMVLPIFMASSPDPGCMDRIIEFMRLNGINLLFASSYDHGLHDHHRQVTLMVFYQVPGGNSLQRYTESYPVQDFNDHQRLRRESTDALRRVLDEIERENR